MTQVIKHITTGTSTTLIAKDSQGTGRISKIYICNAKNSADTLSVIIFDDSNTYYLVDGLVVPANTAFVLEDCVSFDITKHSLKIDYLSSPQLTVIIQ